MKKVVLLMGLGHFHHILIIIFNVLLYLKIGLHPRFKILIEAVSKRFFLSYQFDSLSNTLAESFDACRILDIRYVMHDMSILHLKLV